MIDWKEDYKNRLNKISNGGKKKITQVTIFMDEHENKIVNLYKIQNNHVSKQEAIKEIIRNQRIKIDTAVNGNNATNSTPKNSGQSSQ